MPKKAKKDQPVTKAEMEKSLTKFDARAEEILVAWKAVLGLPKDFAIMPIQVYVCMAAATAVMERFPPTKGEVEKAEETLKAK